MIHSSPIRAGLIRYIALSRPQLTFPSQERIDHGVLIRWTKGFGAGNTEGRDVAAMFNKSIDDLVRATLSPMVPSKSDRLA